MFNVFQKNISENPLWKEQIESRIALREINQKIWLETNLFSPVWWLMLILVFMLWFVWGKLVDKTRLMEIIAYGLMISVTSTIIDIVAVENVLWGYPNRLTPSSLAIVFVNLCLLPVIFMIIYQYFTGWKSFFTALLITSFLLSFVVEPAAVWLDIFQLNNWEYIYSFAVYILMGSLLKLVMNKIKTI